MILIDNTIVSDDVVTQPFACDVLRCKGACCVQGDSGAPLLWEEAQALEQLSAFILPRLGAEGQTAIRRYGHWHWDSDGDLVTPLVDGTGACAYAVTENGIVRCGIERAWQEGLWQQTSLARFSKPISCHLYPVRITRYAGYDALNYDRWDICAPACQHGKKQDIRVFEFVKDALIRRYGLPWYQQLEGAAAFAADTAAGQISKGGER